MWKRDSKREYMPTITQTVQRLSLVFNTDFNFMLTPCRLYPSLLHHCSMDKLQGVKPRKMIQYQRTERVMSLKTMGSQIINYLDRNMVRPCSACLPVYFITSLNSSVKAACFSYSANFVDRRESCFPTPATCPVRGCGR